MNILEIARNTHYDIEIKTLNSWGEYSTEIYFDNKETGITFECKIFASGFKNTSGDNIEEKRIENIYIQNYELELVGVYDSEGDNLDFDSPFSEINEILKENLIIENLI